MREPTIFEIVVKKEKIPMILKHLSHHKLTSGEVACSVEKVSSLESAKILFEMVQKDQGEISIKKSNGNFSTRAEVLKKVSSFEELLSHISKMEKIKELREIRVNLNIEETRISSYRFSEEEHTFYLIGSEGIASEIEELVGERREVSGEEKEEESSEYCIFCGFYKGRKKVCPNCGR